MTISLRNVYNAIGVPVKSSMCRDVLGFSTGHCPSRLSSSRPETSFSVRTFVRGLRQRHFNLEIIIAGVEMITANDWDILDYAVYRVREIYASNGIGVGRVSFAGLAAATSSGHATVISVADMDGAGHDLTDNGDSLPVVIPANMNVTTINADGTVTVITGKSPIPGPCAPRIDAGMNSSVVGIEGEGTGRTLAHEIGHYLGCSHPEMAGPTLMTQTGSVVGDPFNAITIIASDRTMMMSHCTMHDPISGI